MIDRVMKRQLGSSGIQVSGMGLGCWAIGGPFWLNGMADGWGDVDDNESIRAIHCAVEAGVNFFDTADVYGTGHSEEILGQALHKHRQDVVIATKFGYTYHSQTRQITGSDVSPAYIRRACEASLRRLQTDYIDLYQLHVGELATKDAAEVADTLETLQQDGLIRAYGWSTDSPEQAELLVENPHFTGVQAEMNVFQANKLMTKFCEAHNLAIICRSPLAMGFLTGKFNAKSRLPEDDVRGAGHSWVSYFQNGQPRPEFLHQLKAIREILMSDGRTLGQGALAWLWGYSEQAIPIPGFKSIKQVEENAQALQFGPLRATQMQEINEILSSEIPSLA